MPRMPGVVWRPAEYTPRPMDRYDVFCIHTIVGFAPAYAAHFSTTGDGDIFQHRDTLHQSAANYNGNHRVIASENEDHGPKFGGTPHLPQWVPLTPEQVAANGEIFSWLHGEHGIPLQLCPDSRPRSRGLGYHRQGIDGNFDPPTYRFPGRVAGGEVWTLSPGKVCPTDVRIAQLPDILTHALGDDMALSDSDKLWFTETIRREATAAVDKVLESDMNIHEPAGDPAFRDRSVRWVLKQIAKATGAV